AYFVFEGPFWGRLRLVGGVLVPLAAMQFFLAFAAQEGEWTRTLNRAAYASAGVLLVVALTPLYAHLIVGTITTLYGVTLIFASLQLLRVRARAAPSRFERARLRYLVLAGALAGTFTLFEYLPLLGLDIPPVGTVLVLVFLFVLSQSIVRYRLLDLYELAARLAVLTALAFFLASVLWVLVYLAGGRFFLHAVVSALVLLVLSDPIRTKVADRISQLFFRERYDFERTMLELRRRISHVLELDDLVHLLLEGLELSRRTTHASVFFLAPDRHGYELVGHLGPEPPRRLELVPARPLLERLGRDGALVVEHLERDLQERRELQEDREAETLHEIVQTMDALGAGVCVALQSDRGELYGLLCVRDERTRDAFSPEEVQLLGGVAAQAAISVENSQLYQRMKERDRLTALGEMSAGLAHEIRNPLGAIKASAQYLTEPGADAEERMEFLEIIVDEVDRLDRVVASFLDYARPGGGDPAPIDVGAAIGRTLQILEPECAASNVLVSLGLEEELPPVRVDPERLRQVLFNLVRNALQAMEAGGELSVRTHPRRSHDLSGEERLWVELLVGDTGHGIPPEVRGSLFLPFVTTKDRGTGLGLAISQRIVADAGGRIEVRDRHGGGTTFAVLLPAALEPKAQSSGEEGRPEAASGREGAAAPELESGAIAEEGGSERPSVLTASR
ncbi:MAG: ATP-binding protein, partial [Myxococcales bacterium]|nr:ATP-binding protein [Myxococcales bacterium]